MAVLAAFLSIPMASSADPPPLSQDAPPKSKQEARLVFSQPALPPSEIQRAQLAAKRTLLERMTPAPFGDRAISTKPGQITTLIPGTEGSAPLKPLAMMTAPPPPTASASGIENERALRGSTPLPFFASFQGCRLAGLCKGTDRAWIGTEVIDADDIPPPPMNQGRRP